MWKISHGLNVFHIFDILLSLLLLNNTFDLFQLLLSYNYSFYFIYFSFIYIYMVLLNKFINK